MINKQLAVLTSTIVVAAVIIPAYLRAGNEPASETNTRTAAGDRKPPHRLRAREGKGRSRIFEADRFTEFTEDKVMAFAKKHFPEEYERLEALRKENPRQFRRAIRRLWWLYKRVRHLPEEIQAAAVAKHRLNVAIFQTRREFLQAEEADKKAELTKKLSSLLEKQFDNDQTVKEYQIKRLAQQLAELKAQVEQRRKDRKKIIADRLKRLLRPAPPALRATDTPRATRPTRRNPPTIRR